MSIKRRPAIPDPRLRDPISGDHEITHVDPDTRAPQSTRNALCRAPPPLSPPRNGTVCSRSRALPVFGAQPAPPMRGNPPCGIAEARLFPRHVPTTAYVPPPAAGQPLRPAETHPPPRGPVKHIRAPLRPDPPPLSSGDSAGPAMRSLLAHCLLRFASAA